MNATKTEHIVSTRQRGNFDDLSLRYGNSQIEEIEKIMLLWVVLDGKLTFASQAQVTR